MTARKKGRIYFFVWLFAIAFTVVFIFPLLEKMLPGEYLDELTSRDVDPRALFYTESDQALDAYHLLKD